jgi:hypothetical protein
MSSVIDASGFMPRLQTREERSKCNGSPAALQESAVSFLMRPPRRDGTHAAEERSSK